MSNMKQVYMSERIYCNDYKVQRIPFGMRALGYSPQPWCYVDEPVRSDMDVQSNDPRDFWQVILTMHRYIERPKYYTLANLAVTPKILTCPSWQNKRGWGYNKLSDYGINEAFYGFRAAYPKQKHLPKKVMKNPSAINYFGEVPTYTSPATNWATVIDQRHKKTVNFVFLSGHAKSLNVGQIPWYIPGTGPGTLATGAYTDFWCYNPNTDTNYPHWSY